MRTSCDETRVSWSLTYTWREAWTVVALPLFRVPRILEETLSGGVSTMAFTIRDDRLDNIYINGFDWYWRMASKGTPPRNISWNKIIGTCDRQRSTRRLCWPLLGICFTFQDDDYRFKNNSRLLFPSVQLRNDDDESIDDDYDSLNTRHNGDHLICASSKAPALLSYEEIESVYDLLEYDVAKTSYLSWWLSNFVRIVTTMLALVTAWNKRLRGIKLTRPVYSKMVLPNGMVPLAMV